MSLKNKKSVLITGAGTGLGLKAAQKLAERGHKVYLTTHYQDEAEKIKKIFEDLNLGENVEIFKLDILSDDDLKKVENLKLDVLINNAGINDSGSISEIDVEKIRKVYETNIFGTLKLTQLVLKNMINNGSGRIAFVSSLYGIISDEFVAPYCSSKFALEALALSLRQEMKELEQAKIDVCLINPGAYYTGYNEEMVTKQFMWMERNSYFKNKLDYLKKKQMNRFNFFEETNLNSIVVQYVRSVEDIFCRQRYAAPKVQLAYAKLKQFFS